MTAPFSDQRLVPSLLAIIMSVGPGLGVMLYLARRDAIRPDHADVVIRVFIGGIAVTVLAFLAQRSAIFLATTWSLPVELTVAFRAFVGAALVEEALKLCIVLRLAYPSPAFREVNDGIIYAIAAGLGFCCLETILHADYGAAVGLNRAFTALPLHAIASGLMGYEIGMAKLRPRSNRRVWHGLWKAVVIHGTYNFILMLVAEGVLARGAVFLIVPLLAGAYIWLLAEVRLARRKDRAQARAPRRARQIGWNG